jgi:hypothetical protein
MAKKRGTPRRAKRKPSAKRRSTALVVRPKEVPVIQAEPVPERTLTEGTHLGELGLVRVDLTPEQEKILDEPVPEHLVRVKPDGSVYLPHAHYTRWFNRAFGRGGWAVVPVGLPAMVSRTVVCPYVLYINGKPAAFAQGEQEYFEGNRNQSYGDALESTVASALRRCSKRLGVALELWDREWGDAWRRTHAIAVKVTAVRKDGTKYPKTQWRLPTDPPLPFEQRGRVADEEPRYDGDDYGDPDPVETKQSPVDSGRRSSAPPASAQQRRPETHHAHAGDLITQKQRQRFVMIVRNSGRDEQTVLEWLQRTYGYRGSADIRRNHYDAICSAVEGSGELPERRR